jgi:hypothetical protein
MASYSELERLPAEAYLNPDNFRTEYDGRVLGKAEEQYQAGLEYGRNATRISLSYKGVWGASMKNGAMVSSYEGIGYHAETAALLKGFLDSGCAIVVYRSSDSPSGQGAHQIK